MRIWPGSAASASSHRLGAHVPRRPERNRPSDQRLARGNAEAAGQAHAISPEHVGHLGGEYAARFQARPHRPQGIVFVHGSGAEHAYQALVRADRQLSSVPLQDCCQAMNRLLADDFVRLRIQGHARVGGHPQQNADDGDGPARQGFSRRGRYRRGQRVLAQDGGLELTELRRRLQTQLVPQHAPELAVDLERLGLPAVAIEGQHQLAAQTLPYRMFTDQPP